MSDEPIIHIVISGIPAVYFGYILLQGIWGTLTLTSACKAKNLRTSIQGSLVVGSAGLTAMLGYAMCHFHCKKGGEVKYLPTWLMLFILVASIISLVFQFGILNAYSSTDPNDMPCKKDANFKLFTTIGVVLSFIALFSSVVVLVRAMKRKNLEAKKKKTEIVKKSEEEDLKQKVADKEAEKKISDAKKRLDALKKQLEEDTKEQDAAKKQIEEITRQEAELKAQAQKQAEARQKEKRDMEEAFNRKKKHLEELEEARRYAAKMLELEAKERKLAAGIGETEMAPVRSFRRGDAFNIPL